MKNNKKLACVFAKSYIFNSYIKEYLGGLSENI